MQGVRNEKVTGVGKLIFFLSAAFSAVDIATCIKLKHPPVMALTSSLYILIGFILTFGRFSHQTLQKYYLVTVMVTIGFAYSVYEGRVDSMHGLLLAIICMSTMHIDFKLNMFAFVYLFIGTAIVYHLFLDRLMPNLDLQHLAPAMAAFFMAQILLLALIARINKLTRINKAKNSNTATLLKIVEDKRSEAISADKSKSDFLANMSHEIRTPMNAITGMTEFILRENISDSVRANALNIKVASKSLLEIINDILDFSKIEAGKMELIETKYHLSSIINDVANIAAIRIGKKPIQFIVDCSTELPNELLGDEIRIKQVIINLINNAVKFTKQGSITLKAACKYSDDKSRATLYFHVSDTGLGIRQRDLGKLFSSFTQVDTKRNREIEGSGLGLAICKKIVELMDGSIWVESEYGKGSTFSFSVAQAVVDAAPMRDYSVVYENEALKLDFSAPDASVLVVDDNPVNLLVATGMLEPYGVTVTTAASAQECFELLKMNRYDIIFMDHMMPFVDGVEATLKIRETDKDTPIVALTANAISGVREMYMQNGFTDYLVKPFEMKALSGVLLNCLPEGLVVKAGGAEGAAGTAGKKVADNELLHTVYVNGLSKIPLLRQLYEAEDWKNYIIEVHALKSVAATAGNTKLSELAKSHEMAGKVGDIQFIRVMFDTLISMYKGFVDSLEPIVNPPEGDAKPATPKKVLSPNEIAVLFNVIQESADSFDMEGVNTAIDKLKHTVLSDEQEEKLMRLVTAAEMLEYEEIVRICVG